jgi:hypothetical protein
LNVNVCDIDETSSIAAKVFKQKTKKANNSEISQLLDYTNMPVLEIIKLQSQSKGKINRTMI